MNGGSTQHPTPGFPRVNSDSGSNDGGPSPSRADRARRRATTLWTSADGTTAAVGAGGLLFAGPLLMIVARRKYPRWWFDWNLELQRFGSRVVVFLTLMDDRYPSTDERQSVRLDYEYPDAS